MRHYFIYDIDIYDINFYSMLYMLYIYVHYFIQIEKKGKSKIVISSLQDERNYRQTDYNSIDINSVFH